MYDDLPDQTNGISKKAVEFFLGYKGIFPCFFRGFE